MNDLTRFTSNGPIGTLTLNRPEARNALSIDLLRSLHDRADEIACRDDLRVLILTGEGKSFCAGMDLKAVLGDDQAALTLLTMLADLCVRIRSLPLAVLGRVNGAAIGGGCGLVCVCDLAITHADSKMGFPEVGLGVCPAVVAPWLIRRVGAGNARRILLMGGLMTGQQAFDTGIVTGLVPSADDLDAAVAQTAERLASGGAQALQATKNHLNILDGSLDRDQARQGAELSARVLALPESRARLQAALAGR